MHSQCDSSWALLLLLSEKPKPHLLQNQPIMSAELHWLPPRPILHRLPVWRARLSLSHTVKLMCNGLSCPVESKGRMRHKHTHTHAKVSNMSSKIDHKNKGSLKENIKNEWNNWRKDRNIKKENKIKKEEKRTEGKKIEKGWRKEEIKCETC